jgi:hypothetical protein
MLQSSLAALSSGTELFNRYSVIPCNQLRDATIGMREGMASLPREVASIYYDVTRGRRTHLMGSYPRVADLFAANGAAFSSVTMPMTVVKAWLWMRHYADQLPSFMVANRLEEESNHRLNERQHHAIKDPHDSALDALIEACTKQINETRTLRSVALAMRAGNRRLYS